VPTSRAREKVQQRYQYIQAPSYTQPSADEALAASFASFATTVQNRLDNDGSGSPIALNGSLEAQVERALSQASRQQAPLGGGATSIATALATTPTAGSYLGSTPALPPAQTVLVSEATTTQSDMLAALDALQTMSSFADASDVDAYRNIVRAEVLALTTEFARPDLPRPVRVRVLFGALLGWAFAPDYPLKIAAQPTGDLAALDYLLDLCSPVVPSAFTEDQFALQDVVSADARRLFDLWVSFEYQYIPKTIPGKTTPPIMWPKEPRTDLTIGGLAAVVNGFCASGSAASSFGASARRGAKASSTPLPPYTFSERMIRADLLLPVLSHDCDQVAGALDAIGFGPGAQETVEIPGLLSLTDTDLRTGNINLVLPILRARQYQAQYGLTVKDILDWASDLGGGAGYDLLRQAGQIGLDLLADQADELYWIVLALLGDPDPPLPELGDSQVQIELISLARDLSALADLSN
jgi:hypothetical protein